MNYNKIAATLDDASQNAEAIEQISKTEQISLDEAYAIQSISIGNRYKRQEKFVGIKLGFTSRAKMEQMGVHDLIWGKLTDRMQFFDSEQMERSDFIHPRAEPEVGFLMKKDLDKQLDHSNVMEYVDKVCIAIEIIDSRYQDFKFSLEDVVADNCSSSGFILGDWLEPSVNFQDSPIKLSINGISKQEGNTKAILGDPIESLIEASRLMMENGEELLAGHIVLAGAATAAEYVEAGMKVTASSPDLGSVELEVV